MALTIKQAEDYLTNRVSGITVMDVTVEYPDQKEVLYIEGEKDYFFFISADDTYRFTDGQKNEKAFSHEDSENPMTEEEFLDKMVRVILSEE
ncbi:hypothetical protein [Enterococcus sp. S86.2]|uniref:hypothetical protein n=1 Tax=Enterococcus sp. S86.2 TaxID=3031299 RepID=UPI0026E9FC5F|nr:hypothetical protein [Enterococcus sp. S86.2]